MRCKQIAALGMVGALFAAGVVLATGSVASATDATNPRKASCLSATDDAWPSWTDGRPAQVDPDRAAGVYMWHDGTGWHLRVTHQTDTRRTFSGELVTAGRFVGVSSVRLEGNDSRHVSPDHHMITFRFENYGGIDGLNFRTYCAPSIAFTFVSDGDVLAASDVTIGHGGSNPTSDPFSIVRS
ncbi:MAG: hypothetical protein ACLPVY_05305 [Acidimicrobiia bacterium]